MISELASTGLGRIYGAAVSSFGWQIGKNIHKNFGNILILVIALIIGAGGIVLPFMAGRRLVQSHPEMSGVKYFFRIFVIWVALAALGIAILFAISCIIFAFKTDTSRMTDAQLWAVIAPKAQAMTITFAIASIGGGFLKGLTERGKRKRVYAVMIDNQNFLDSHGIRSVDGGSVTHIDGDNNRMKLDHIGNDLIEFAVSGGRKAFITIAPDGRFIEYSGAVSG